MAVMVGCSSSSAATGKVNVTRQAFGLHVHGLARGTAWPNVEFGSLRLWDAGVTWRDLEPANGVWRFDTLDSYVNRAAANRVEVLYTLGQTPTWASARPSEASPYGAGAAAEPRVLADWADYVRTLALRYKGRIKYWELWNEIDSRQFFSGESADLVKMAKIAYGILKEVDPGNIVLTPSVQGGATRSLARYLEAGGGNYADVISYHFYVPEQAPEAMLSLISSVRAVMERNGIENKPLWNTETGWLIENSDGNYGDQERPAWRTWKRLKREEAAAYVVRAYAIAFSGGVERFYWYAWDNKAMGLAEKKGSVRKVAGDAYQKAYDWLVGGLFSGCNVRDAVWVCEVRRAGKKSWLVWAAADATDFAVPAAWRVVSAESVTGATTKWGLGSNRIKIGELPVMLRSDQ